ncbi:MAG: endonuclease III [Firmicutes bacterium]|nr:endonuclease III [Bacillota bacterium]
MAQYGQIARIAQRLRRINELLRAMYGPKRREDEDPLDALIMTILSQNTSDINSHRAFANLKERFPSWDDARRADVGEIRDAIKVGGLAQVKTGRIKQALERIQGEHGRLGLEFLKDMDAGDALRYLRSFEGVGPKTAACVLLFGCGRPIFPVDTHIHRIARRLGLIGKDVGADEAHEVLGELVPDDIVYELHVNMIAHGRTRCRPHNPRCDDCLLAGECWYYRGAAGDRDNGWTERLAVK